MFARTTLCALCSAMLLWNLNLAEWVDMPQFSDEGKVYRIPSVQQDQFYKFRRGHADYHGFPDDPRNDSRVSRRPVVKIAHVTDDKNEKVKRIHSVPESTTASYLFPVQIANADTAEEDRGPASIGDATTENKSVNKHRAVSTMRDTTTYDALTSQSPPSSTIPASEAPQDESYNNRTLKQEDGILQYLPVDILKSVHRTLQSQPVSFEGKIHFLETFEKTLMSEIESRLVTTMTPRRRTRGAHYHGHGYDKHEDHSVGFPSIEGALMAISFLTFAVYLVRLVMLLFRNITNPTTTATTLLLGRRKRFTTDFDDDTARILGNLNSFVSNF